MRKQKNRYEGLQESIRGLKTRKIEVWRNKYSDKDYTINIEAGEFSCICPKTGLPDYAQINVEYIPDKFCVELKSFKLYLLSYRDIGVFHEHVINKILDDFVKASRPRQAKIIGRFNTRGGIVTTVTRQYSAI
jgi:7-cyano-7-deazaguanine reductase